MSWDKQKITPQTQVKEESHRAGLKLNIQKDKDHGIWPHHFMANRWGRSGNNDSFFFLGSKISVDSDCSHEIKTHLLLGKKKVMTNLDSILKSQRHYFADKVIVRIQTIGPYSTSYGFSTSHVWIWELDIKKDECWRIDAFKLWCCKRLLRVPWTARRSNQSILKEINTEYSLEGWSWSPNSLATWCEEPTH